MIAKGQKISDRYQILKSIGEGGMANVYLAYDIILERNVAVKVLRGDLATDEKFVRRFQREALQASSLNNENIVEVYDVGEDAGEYYIVMEYVEGKHLKNLLKKRGKLTIPEVVDILLQVTSGLSVAHDSYVIHRDIKPQNIMILDSGLVKLTDFGIAVAMNSTQLTQTNSVMGSVHYLPPEQASGKGATLQSDIYSLGILMYELLTGKLPYRGDNAVEIALKHLKEPLPSIRNLIPDIPQSIENIILRATAKNPKNRYADAREMHEDLLTCLEESRKNEERITYKYPDHDYDDTKILKIKKEANVPNNKSEKKNKEGEDVIAKKITEGDLKSQNKTMIILIAIFTSIVVLITTIVVFLPMLSKSSQKEVPDVSNMTVTEAIKALSDAGFTVLDEQREKSSSVIPEGMVISTSPAGGTLHKKGYEITLIISSGNEGFELEDYTGRNYYEVKGALESHGIKVHEDYRTIDPDDNTTYKENIIIDQSVKAGEILTSGDEITLYLPDVKTFYPDFTDGAYTVIEVLEFCEENDIKCSFIDNKSKSVSINADNSLDYSEYAIISQTRSAGTKVTSGAKLTIKLDFDSANTITGPLDVIRPEENSTCSGGLC